MEMFPTVTIEPVSAISPGRRAPRAHPLRIEDRGKTLPRLAPRFHLSSMELSGAELYVEPSLFAMSRGTRRRQRDPGWVTLLSHGCALASELPDHLRVAVPVDTGADAVPDDLLSQIATSLHDSGQSLERLDLEFTEASLATDSDMLAYSLSVLRDLGAGLVLCGLGTGTTSLTLVRDRTFAGLLTSLKLDRHLFLEDPTHRESGRALARAIVRLGTDFGLDTRAEGIEKPDILAFLREIGCTEGRGGFMGAPQPMPDFLSHYREARKTPAKV